MVEIGHMAAFSSMLKINFAGALLIAKGEPTRAVKSMELIRDIGGGSTGETFRKLMEQD